MFISTSSADLNLDGFADLVIGAPLDDGAGLAGAQRGAVFIHLGSAAGPSAAPDLTILGQEDGGQFGSSIAFVADINGGGRDLIIGAPFDDADGNTGDNGLDRGRVFVFFGGAAALDNAADATVNGPQYDGLAGAAIAN